MGLLVRAAAPATSCRQHAREAQGVSVSHACYEPMRRYSGLCVARGPEQRGTQASNYVIVESYTWVAMESLSIATQSGL